MSDHPAYAAKQESQMLGLAAFDSLRAEYEPWLEHCYVPTGHFPLMVRWRSALAFGKPGSGKTALRLALERDWCPPGDKPGVLLVHWPVNTLASPELKDTNLVQEFMGQVLDAVTRALLQHLGQYPGDWSAMPSWSQDSLVWFVQRYLRGDLNHYISSLGDETPPDGLALLRDVVSLSVPDVLHAPVANSVLITEVVRFLEKLSLAGVRITVDGLEPLLAIDAQVVAERLGSFLNTLALFEHPHFAYTMLLPAVLESPLGSTGGISRGRIDPCRLTWNMGSLTSVVEHRLAWALGEEDFPLEKLAPAKALRTWLEGCCGDSPSEWLETARPFLAAYLVQAERQGTRSPLTGPQLREVQKSHRPQLVLDLKNGIVTVGRREVQDLQDGQIALLKHLDQHRGHICRRKDVYRAYLEGTGREMPEWEREKDYANALDNAIRRLRLAIEPDPSYPVWIFTIRGKGVRLGGDW